MTNRSLRASLLFTVVILLTFTVSCSSPAQRRSRGFVDRLLRTNPLRAFARHFSRKLALNVYYPPPPPKQLIHQPQALFYVPETSVPSHYTKVPALPPLYFAPQQVAMIPIQTQQQQQVMPPPPPQVPKYVLHGVSYPVPFLPQQQSRQYPLQQLLPVIQVQPVMPTYAPTITQQSTNFLQQQSQSQVQITTNPQTGILVSERHQVQHYTKPQPSSSVQVESPQQQHHSSSGNSDDTLVTLPTIVSSADNINDDSSTGLLSLPEFPQLSPSVQMQIDGYQDTSSSDDMLKIFVIRPKDMEKIKSSSEAEREELAKGYSTKYVDVEQGAQEMVLNGDGGSENGVNSQQDACIEPLCDQFLRKLIPELFSSGSFNKNDDPIVIIKNNSDSVFPEVNPILKNNKLDEPVSTPNEDHLQFTLVRSVENAPDGSDIDIYQGQDSTLKPQSIKLHFPRKKFLSAKINSTENYKSKDMNGVATNLYQYHENRVYKPLSVSYSLPNRNEHNISTSTSVTLNDQPMHSWVPKPRNYNNMERLYPYYRYGSNMMAKRSPVRDSDNKRNNGKVNEDTSVRSKMAHYAAGVIFNDSKVPKL